MPILWNQLSFPFFPRFLKGNTLFTLNEISGRDKLTILVCVFWLCLRFADREYGVPSHLFDKFTLDWNVLFKYSFELNVLFLW